MTIPVPKQLELNRFYQVYVIPKKKRTDTIDYYLDSQSVVDSYVNFYQTLILNFGLLNQLGPTALVLFDRFFDLTSTLRLKLADQLQDFLVTNLKNSQQFTENLMNSKISCIKLGNYMEQFDYVDNLKFMEIEDKAFYIVLPIFVISSNPSVSSTELILNQFKNPKLTKDEVQSMCFNKVMDKVRTIAGPETQVFSGLFRTEADVASFIIQQNQKIRAMNIQSNQK